MNLQDKRLRIIIIALVAIVGVVAFRVISNIVARNKEANSSRQGRMAVITAAYPKRETIIPKFRFSGTLDPVWQADVAAKVEGRIEKVLVEEGQAVTAGQPLVVLEQEDTAAGVMNARGTYLDAKTSYEKARMDVQRFEALYEKGAVSKEALDNVRFALENARGKLDAARGNLNSAESALGGTTVTTPRSGIIQKRYFQEGYYAKEGTALFNIADISTLQAKIDIPEGYVNSVAVGGQVEFTIPSMRGENKKVRGIITRISPVAVQPARTFEAEVTVDNRNSLLRGGMYAEALITAIPKENVLTIPMTAISMRDDQRTCYVIEDGKAVRKVLTTGYIGENLVEVLSGVSEKDHVITGGLNKVREGADVKVSEKGMAAND
ncbi:MAG: efflux RND transporter periplasmic adaptor subunit [Succiniclasticum sp.]|uniref:efflux RND transporter periplasmic adaptor subunit n=1 Tax=Succiniclasticum sp. TaxID=2775030 RepID=UPI001B032BCF|nr:efflux RND transporter periplasmic adaptor subunit [Succiniclasticum sp.]MBO5637585.1 efflux RND transporter periplasmic adaptor subunit [Acidaminococcaceae bacterium]MDY6290335.1 efflux RND transporter periplasmic adaptor subunit [Succiniclasticum sp.]